MLCITEKAHIIHSDHILSTLLENDWIFVHIQPVFNQLQSGSKIAIIFRSFSFPLSLYQAWDPGERVPTRLRWKRRLSKQNEKQQKKAFWFFSAATSHNFVSTKFETEATALFSRFQSCSAHHVF